MFHHIAGIILAGVLATSSAIAQTAPSSADKQETSCNKTSATTGNAGSAPTNSMAMEKSAILPSAGGHANSAAPTVQSDNKAMQVRPDCPPDSQTK